MTNQHPVNILAGSITGWRTLYRENYDGNLSEIEYIAANAAQWGADQELEACCEWFICDWTDIETADKLRSARRPKPPTLNSIALQMLDTIERDAHYIPEITDTIRRALEALDD